LRSYSASSHHRNAHRLRQRTLDFKTKNACHVQWRATGVQPLAVVDVTAVIACKRIGANRVIDVNVGKDPERRRSAFCTFKQQGGGRVLSASTRRKTSD
jgi:hypothetical protein